MRFAVPIDSARIAPPAVSCVAVALIAVSAGIYGQEPVPAQFATLAQPPDTGATPPAAVEPIAAAARDAAIATVTANVTDAAAEAGQLTGSVLSVPADGASANDISLDDEMLSRQRGGAFGMTVVAATPQLMRGNGSNVTLWDEIAPPSPLPVPVDAARAAQGNVAMY